MTQSFLKYCCINVFIYLETDYLKRFYFSALFCTVFFCHDLEMIDQLNYYCCNDIITTMYFVIFNFLFQLQKQVCHYQHLLGSEVWKYIGSQSVNSVSRSVTVGKLQWQNITQGCQIPQGLFKKKTHFFSKFAEYKLFLKSQLLFLFKSTPDVLRKHKPRNA